jgi:hypothetical protein
MNLKEFENLKKQKYANFNRSCFYLGLFRNLNNADSSKVEKFKEFINKSMRSGNEKPLEPTRIMRKRERRIYTEIVQRTVIYFYNNIHRNGMKIFILIL